MTEFPFQLLIRNTSSKNTEESLLCTALLRVIPGRRTVYDALWNDNSVIAKLFSHRRHYKREWDGLNELMKRGLNSPRPLFYGKTEDGRWAVITEKIADSSTVLDVLQKTEEPARKSELLIAVCKELAKQHTKGVVQKDLHLGNFMLADDRVFLLDPGQIRFLRSKTGKKTGISQLALLACCLPDSDAGSISKLFEEYFKARDWKPGKSDEALLQKQLAVHRKKGIRRGLKKCLRTSKRHLKIKSGRYLAVFDKAFCPGVNPLDFMEKVDALMNKGEILKDGNTCYVSRLTWNNSDVVVKRYNHKGLIHSLRHTIKRSRARHGWLHGHRLGMLQIPTPKPLAYIELRKTGLIWQSYLITEYAEGQNLYNFLRDSNITEEKRSIVTRQVTELIDMLGKNKITHGDLKHTNILVTDSGPVITDLDGMKAHKWNRMYKNRQEKDLKHIRNF